MWWHIGGCDTHSDHPVYTKRPPSGVHTKNTPSVHRWSEPHHTETEVCSDADDGLVSCFRCYVAAAAAVSVCSYIMHIHTHTHTFMSWRCCTYIRSPRTRERNERLNAWWFDGIRVMFAAAVPISIRHQMPTAFKILHAYTFCVWMPRVSYVCLYVREI